MKDLNIEKEKTPLISIIIPVYNGELYLSKCLDSVVGQTYHNLQIILIDDGSTDSSGSICDWYASMDERIEVIHCENGGQAKARNHGLDLAKGEWIGFADDDDILEPEMYEVLLHNALEHKVLISGCSTLTIKEDGQTYNTFDCLNSGIREGKEIILDLFYFSPHTYGALWNKIFHNSLKEDLYFPEGCQLEDYYVAIKMYCKASKIYFEQNPMYHWFSRNSSQSHKGFYQGKLTIMQVCDSITSWIEANTSDAELVRGAYHYQYVSYVGVMSMMWKSDDSRKIVRNYLKGALDLKKKAKEKGCHSSAMSKANLKCLYWRIFA